MSLSPGQHVFIFSTGDYRAPILGATVAPWRAIFSPDVSLGNLSGDFAPSADCQGLE